MFFRDSYDGFLTNFLIVINGWNSDGSNYAETTSAPRALDFTALIFEPFFRYENLRQKFYCFEKNDKFIELNFMNGCCMFYAEWYKFWKDI